MHLESGPARTDRNWWLLRTLVCLGIAAWFIYDGAVGYRQRNREAAELKLNAPEPFNGRIKFNDLGAAPTKADFDRMASAKATTVEQARTYLGNATQVNGADQYYVSRYGYAKLTVREGRIVSTPTWVTWAKSKEEIDHQYYWAIIALVPGLYFLWRLIRAAILRVVIDDEGMTYGGRRVAFADMVSLRDYSPKGWIDLYYKRGEKEKKLRLDNEKVRRFDEIVAAICEKKGFSNEVHAYAEKKARAEQEEQEAAAAEAAPKDPGASGDARGD